MSENKRVIEHKHTLDIKLTIILALFAIGILAHAFAPSFSVNESQASTRDYDRGYEDGYNDGENDC